MSPVNRLLGYALAVIKAASVEVICAQVAHVLREERVKRGLSMTVVAQRAGLSQAMISFVERGIRNPSLETLVRISMVLATDLDDILRRARIRSGGSRKTQ